MIVARSVWHATCRTSSDMFEGRVGVLLGLPFVAGCLTGSGSSASDLKATGVLAIEASSTLDLAEASGLAAAGDEVIAIGDSDAAIVRFGLDAKGRATGAERVGLSKLVPVAADGSQWEAVAVDGARRIFVLSEYPSVVYVFDPSLHELVHTIALEVPSDSDAY